MLLQNNNNTFQAGLICTTEAQLALDWLFLALHQKTLNKVKLFSTFPCSATESRSSLCSSASSPALQCQILFIMNSSLSLPEAFEPEYMVHKQPFSSKSLSPMFWRRFRVLIFLNPDSWKKGSQGNGGVGKNKNNWIWDVSQFRH